MNKKTIELFGEIMRRNNRVSDILRDEDINLKTVDAISILRKTNEMIKEAISLEAKDAGTN